MTLPRTGQRNDGNALVVSAGLADAAGSAGFSSTRVFEGAARSALCCGAAGVTARVAGGDRPATCWAGAGGAGTGPTAALLFAPGTVSFMPMLSLADVSRLLARASSPTGT